MTKAFLILKDLDGESHTIKALKGNQILMSDETAVELGMDNLVNSGHVKAMTDEEALAHHKGE